VLLKQYVVQPQKMMGTIFASPKPDRYASWPISLSKGLTLVAFLETEEEKMEPLKVEYFPINPGSEGLAFVVALARGSGAVCWRCVTRQHCGWDILMSTEDTAKFEKMGAENPYIDTIFGLK